MGRPIGHALSGLEFPGRDGPVGRTAGEDVGVGAPREVGHAGLVLAEVEELAAVLGLPDHHVAVAVRGREQDAVGAEVRARHPFGMLGDRVEQLASGRVEALHLLGVRAHGDALMVRADVGRHQLVEFLADFGDAPAGLHVPDDGVAELTAAAAAHDEERTIGAELKRTRVAFGIRQDAREFAGLGVVEQDLLLAGDGEERGPRARRHGRDGRDARGDHDRLQQDVFRTCDGAGRLARTGG